MLLPPANTRGPAPFLPSRKPSLTASLARRARIPTGPLPQGFLNWEIISNQNAAKRVQEGGESGLLGPREP